MDAHLRRCRLIEGISIATAIAVLLIWLALHAAYQNWEMAIATIVTLFGGAVVWLVAHSGYESIASLIVQISCTILVFTFCLTFDNGADGYPRSTHLFFMSIMIYSYYRYTREPSTAQIGIISVCFVGFCVLATFEACMPEPFQMDHRVFAFGGPVNAVAALALLSFAVGASQNEMTKRNAFLADVRRGINGREFVLYLQPQTNRAGEIYGAEALIRWNHPKEGFLPPAHFIPLIERWDQSDDLAQFITKSTFETLKVWRNDRDLSRISISINLSPRDLVSRKLIDYLVAHYEESGLDRGQVKIEITESMAISDRKRTSAAIYKLQTAGYKLSLDDFGVGYSGLARLRDLHLSEVKLDKSFTDVISDVSRCEAIVSGIVTIARDLGASVLAEGVETEDQWNDLKRLGCDSFQGYLFGRPMPKADFEGVVRSRAS